MTFINILVVNDSDSDIPSDLTKQTQSQSCAPLPPILSESGIESEINISNQKFKSINNQKNKRASSFVDNWKTNRDWLVYVEGEGMYCTVCQKANKCPFDRDTWNKTPGTHIRLETVKSHENCSAHKDAVLQDADVRRCETITENIQPEICLSSMAKTFACVYFLCKNRIAHTTNFGPLVDFIDFVGVKLSKICIGKNATYRSDKSIQEMLYAMSDLIENQILDDLKNPIFLLLCSTRQLIAVS